MRQVALTGLVLAVLLSPPRLNGETIIDHDVTIDYDLEGDVQVVEGADPPTTVSIVEDGIIFAGSLQVYDSSIVNLLGGILYLETELHDSSTLNTLNIGDGAVYLPIRAYASSTVNVSGGEILAPITLSDASVANVSGGRFSSGIGAYETSEVIISGGEFRNFGFGAAGSSAVSICGGTFHPVSGDDGTPGLRMRASGLSTLSILGGTFWGGEDEYNYCRALDSATVNITAGQFDEIAFEAYDSSTVSISGGTVELLRAGSSSGAHTSVITVKGTGFNYPYGEIPDRSGTLTGVLASGDPIDAPFEIHAGAAIRLVPEPCSAALFAALGVTLFVFTARAAAAERIRRQR